MGRRDWEQVKVKKTKYEGDNVNAAALEFFDLVAKESHGEYDAKSERGLKVKVIEYNILSNMVSDIDIVGKRILDAGCGPGRAIARLTRGDAHIVGVDASINMLRICQEKFSDNKRVELILADIQHLQFKKQSFDIVICVDTLQYFAKESRARILSSLIELVMPGGRIITDVKNSWCPYYYFKRSDVFAQYYSIHTITRILRNAGCVNIKMKGIYFPTIISPIVVIRADIPLRRNSVDK